MREIKFRAFDHENKEMIDSNALYLSEEFEPLIYSFRNFQNSFFVDENGKEADKWSLMQFTGLKDKNGKEIYEGDICRFYECEDDYLMFHGLAYINNNVVGGQWKIIKCNNYLEETNQRGEEVLDSSSFWNDDFEIIGNIHENPELLTQNN